MAKHKIAFFEVDGWQKDYLKKKLNKYEVVFFKDDIDPKLLKKVKDIDILGVFVGSQVDDKVLSALPRVKFITTLSTGFDHIDLQATASRKIPVTNVPFYGENTVAEHAMALLLAISRKITESEERTNKGVFDYDGLEGFDLQGKTIGVVGTGHIGQHVIKMANGFDMKVIAFDKFPNKALEKQLNFKYLPLNQLLAKSDIISLHVPYMPSTHHLLNSKNIKLIKKGAVLINTARGGLIETKAMVKALQDKRLSALGLDVLEEEENVKDHVAVLSKKTAPRDIRITLENHILMSAPNVIMTPHNAFNSREALTRILDTTIENIESFVKGKKLNNLVKPRK